MAEKESVIQVENLSKSFLIPHEKNTSLKQEFLSVFKKSKGYTHFKALEDINFEIKKGEFFGIIGKNGSGKSTLLKILAGIYIPDKGKVKIEGRLSPFLELGVGFNPELTARDNVFLNGAILGLSRKEVEEKFDEIIEFAELEEFVDMKLKNFSSGMQVRLAFSVAIQAHAEILLIDEVLAVGDAAFQEKCFKTFRKLKKEGRTIVFVTHDMTSVREFCDRAMLINDAKIETIGSVERAVQRYGEINREIDQTTDMKFINENRWGNFKAKVEKIRISDKAGKPKKTFKVGDDLKISIDYSVKEPIKNPNIDFAIFREDGIYCYDTNTELDKVKLDKLEKGGTIALTYKNIPLQRGNYFFKIGFYKDYDKEVIDFIDRGPEFTVEGEDQFGIVHIAHDWGK
jgi:ABC-type polysaccharide/polyol phosphate transport system ATPase subunit